MVQTKDVYYMYNGKRLVERYYYKKGMWQNDAGDILLDNDHRICFSKPK